MKFLSCFSTSMVYKVTVEGEDRETEIRYVIRDNGIGIKPENHEKIFDPFARVGGSTRL